jgi:hypothetical protein
MSRHARVLLTDLWSTVLLLRWSTVLLLRWSTVLLLRWSTVLLLRWSTVLLLRWSTVLLLRWSTVLLLRWSTVLLLRWSTVLLLRRSLLRLPPRLLRRSRITRCAAGRIASGWVAIALTAAESAGLHPFRLSVRAEPLQLLRAKGTRMAKSPGSAVQREPL